MAAYAPPYHAWHYIRDALYRVYGFVALLVEKHQCRRVLPPSPPHRPPCPSTSPLPWRCPRSRYRHSQARPPSLPPPNRRLPFPFPALLTPPRLSFMRTSPAASAATVCMPFGSREGPKTAAVYNSKTRCWPCPPAKSTMTSTRRMALHQHPHLTTMPQVSTATSRASSLGPTLPHVPH